MTKILIRLGEEENKTVEHYKTVHGLKTKEEAVKAIVRSFKARVRFDEPNPVVLEKKT